MVDWRTLKEGDKAGFVMYDEFVPCVVTAKGEKGCYCECDLFDWPIVLDDYTQSSFYPITESAMDEFYYYVFVLGYDLMQKEFANSKDPECDVVFDECRKMATKFMVSNDYLSAHKSAYEALQEWLGKDVI